MPDAKTERDLNDRLWARAAPLLPPRRPHPKGGRPWADDRACFEGIVHVLRNGLIPVVTLVALGIPTIFGGAIVTEQIFRVPGIGELLVTAIGNGDTPVVTAVLFIFAVLVVFFNLIADVLYTVLDPRLRLA